MPDLTLLIKKHGETKGRELYNDFHREYRRKNRKRLNKYKREWEANKRAEKAK